MVVIVLAALTAGCVRKDEHEAVLADLAKARDDNAKMTHQLQAIHGELARLTKEAADRDQKLSEATTTTADLERKLEELSMLNAEMADRLQKAGQSVEQLASERGTLNDALEDAKSKLAELKKQQRVAEARAAQFKKLIAAFKSMVDAGQLEVVMRDGRMLIQLKNDILFDSGKTTIKKNGQQTLKEVAKVLSSLKDRQFQVAGHTDDVKISTSKFPSNWELSTARSVEVVKFLIDSGMRPSSLSAAGYGEFDPAAPNDSAENRAKNRRIEIALVPNLSEIIQLPTEDPAPDASKSKPDATASAAVAAAPTAATQPSEPPGALAKTTSTTKSTGPDPTKGSPEVEGPPNDLSEDDAYEEGAENGDEVEDLDATALESSGL